MRLQPKHIPNILTIFRMALVPIIVVFMLVPFGPTIYSFTIFTTSIHLYGGFRVSFTLAGILFAIACITDWLDGFLARKNKWVSDFGKLWDPVADKVLINSVLISFLFQSLPMATLHHPMIPIWIPIIMIARDVIVDATRMYASSKQVVIPANIWGKIKTITQMLAILIIFFAFNMIDNSSKDLAFSVGYYGVQNLMMMIATFFSILSGGIYLVKFYKTSKKSKK